MCQYINVVLCKCDFFIAVFSTWSDITLRISNPRDTYHQSFNNGNNNGNNYDNNNDNGNRNDNCRPQEIQLKI